MADGLSRNPANRDALRTRDLEGLVGQLRRFSLGEYLDDEGEGTIIIPRSFLSDGAASAARAPPAAVKEVEKNPKTRAKDSSPLDAQEEVAVISTSVLAGLMKGAGVVPTSKVLSEERMTMTSSLMRRLRNWFGEAWDIRIALHAGASVRRFRRKPC